MPTQTPPSYYKLYHDTWQAVRELPKVQAGKLLFALFSLYFDGIEPDSGSLPREARRAYQVMRPSVLSYRRSVVNGSKNCKENRRKTAENSRDKQDKKQPKTEQETDAQTDEGFQASTDALPADTLEVGTYPDTNQAAALGTDAGTAIINQESLNSTRGASHAPRAARAKGTRPIIDTHSTVSPTELEDLIAQTSGTPGL